MEFGMSAVCQVLSKWGDGLKYELCFLERENGAAYLFSDELGAAYTAKVKKGEAAGLLREEYQRLLVAQRKLPGLTPVPVLLGEADGCCVLVRTYVPGQTLLELIREGDPITAKTFRRVVCSLCDTLIRLHGAGMVCRDIKPENVVLTADNQCVLIDMESARNPREGGGHDTRLYLTEGFAAPEQFGFCQSDPRADIYGLGMTIAALYGGTTEDPEGAKMPRRVRRIFRKCTRFDPKARYRDAKQLKHAVMRKPLLRAMIALGTAVLAALILFLPKAFEKRIPVVSSQAELQRAIWRIPEGGTGTIEATGEIELEGPVYFQSRNITLTGDAHFNGAGDMAFRVRDYGTVLNLCGDFVVSTQGGAALSLGAGTVNIYRGVYRTVRETYSGQDDVISAAFIDGGSVINLYGGEIEARSHVGGAFGVLVAPNGEFHQMGGRVECSGASNVKGVVVNEPGGMTMKDGVISVITVDGKFGESIIADGKASVNLTGGAQLVNGRPDRVKMGAPVDVYSYQELIKYIEGADGGTFYLNGDITCLSGLRIDGKSITIKGREGSRLIAGFEIAIGSSGMLELGEGVDVVLAGNGGLTNLGGVLSLKGAAVTRPEPPPYSNYAMIHNTSGTLTMSGPNTLTTNQYYAIKNERGAVAELNMGDITTQKGPVAVANYGVITIGKEVTVRASGNGAVAVWNAAGGTCIDQGATLLENGEAMAVAQEGYENQR